MNISYKQYQLKNGIKLIYIPRKDNNITCISTFCRVGSIDEPRHLQGASHFLEHMLFKGTEQRPTSKEISSELDSVGAYFNAYTDKNVTSYIVKLNSDYTEMGLNILSDMICNSKILSEDIDTEKMVVIEEINKTKDNPSDRIVEYLYQTMFEGHPLGHSIGGDDKTILSYQRQDIYNYYKKYYHANNLVIAISSNLSFSKIKDMIVKKTYFPSLPGINFSMEYQKFKAFNQPKICIENEDLQQVHLMLGFPVCDMYHKDRYVLDLIKIILAGNMSSRLFMDLREKHGLSYNVSVDLSYYEKVGHFSVITSFDKDSLFIKNISELSKQENKDKYLKENPGGIKLILDNLLKLKKKLVSSEELSKIKGFIRGHLVLEREDSHSITDYFGRQVIQGHNPIVNFNDLLEKYSSVTSNEIRKISRKYFNLENINIVVIGNYEKVEIKNYLNENYLNSNKEVQEVIKNTSIGDEWWEIFS